MSLSSASLTLAPASLRLRAATAADAPLLNAWDREPHVAASLSDDGDDEPRDWDAELAVALPESHYLIAEVEGRPVGAMQVIDPHLDPEHYWGEIEPNLRALDIWIGPAEWLGRGFGARMMELALDRCFADPAVTAVVLDPLTSNTDAHRFYRRLGFVAEGRRMFDEDDCLIHRLTRAVWTERAAA